MIIGILTFWWSQDNYGQLMQCYALQKYLRNVGHDVKIIPYNNKYDYISRQFWKRVLKVLNPVLLSRYAKKKIHMAAVLDEQSKNNRHFDEFRKEFLHFYQEEYKSYSQLVENPPIADVYIVGSDLVWGVNAAASDKRYENIINAYLLNFGKSETKRFSYAASWGTDSIKEESAAIIAPLLKRFDYVSVREKSGVELCRKCGYGNAEWVCDPTMLLSAKNYREVYNGSKIRKCDKPFLLLYMLNNRCDFDIEKVYEFAAVKGLEVVYVTGNGRIDRYEKFFATIPEWLYLIDCAEYVITNSFHGSVLSTIMETKYGVVKLCREEAGKNVRFDSLFERCGIEKRFITNEDFSAMEKEYQILNAQESGFLKKLWK